MSEKTLKERVEKADDIEMEVNKYREEVSTKYADDLSDLIIDYMKENNIKGIDMYLFVNTLISISVGFLDAMHEKYDPNREKSKEEVHQLIEKIYEFLDQNLDVSNSSHSMALLLVGSMITNAMIELSLVLSLKKEKE